MIDVLTQNAVESYQKEGDTAFRDGDLAAAAALYSKALSTDASNAWAEYSLAEVYRCQGDPESAALHYTKALKLDPFSSSPFIQLLFTKVKLQHLDPIAAFYEQLGTSKPRNPWASVRLGDILTKQRKVDSAIASYKAASHKLLQNNYPDYVSQHWNPEGSSEPTYIIIGPMKTATSALYEYINQHPKVLPSIKKEIHFFNQPECLAHGKDWYLSHFPPITKGSGYITGEASPGYIANNVHDTVFSLFPNAKIIALVRDPVARAFSHHTHNCKHGFERRPFAEAITSELSALDLLKKDIPLAHIAKRWNWGTNPGYVLLGLYHHFLQQWYATFPSNQILVVNNQALSTHPQETMQEVFSFLQIDSYSATTYPKHNAGSYDSLAIDPELKARLQSFYEPYEAKLTQLLTR